MKRIHALLFATSLAALAAGPQTFTGTVTDSMCVMNHKMMNISPDSKCARECVKTKNSKWVLFDGKNAYKLSDQQTPEQFAAEKVTITGKLFPKTGIIQVQKIERTKRNTGGVP
jgi:hypothetical protein